MDEAEKIRLATVEAVKYLKSNGFPEQYLGDIHHNCKEKYNDFFTYWESSINKITSPKNFLFSQRVIYIMDNHKISNKKFFNLKCSALQEFPK